MQLLARLRLLLARRPWIYWLAVAIAAVAVGVATARTLAGIDAARLAWGRQQTVWIATAATEPGQQIVAERREVPQAVVPIGAVDREPSSMIARQRMSVGEIVTADDVAVGGTAGLIPAGWVAFPLPVAGGQFVAGDHVVVYSGDQRLTGGMVVFRDDSDVMVAVPESAGASMATGLLANSVTVALTPDP